MCTVDYIINGHMTYREVAGLNSKVPEDKFKLAIASTREGEAAILSV